MPAKPLEPISAVPNAADLAAVVVAAAELAALAALLAVPAMLVDPLPLEAAAALLEAAALDADEAADVRTPEEDDAAEVREAIADESMEADEVPDATVAVTEPEAVVFPHKACSRATAVCWSVVVQLLRGRRATEGSEYEYIV